MPGSLLAALFAAAAFVVAHSINDTTVVSVALSPHAIPDRPGFIPHDPRFCISPPPFGKQCTMHATEALRACLGLRGCRGLVCPDPTPYARGQPRRRITGPVCQARGRLAAGERNHDMCKPRGCAHVAVDRPPAPTAAVSLPERLPPWLEAGLVDPKWVPVDGGGGGRRRFRVVEPYVEAPRDAEARERPPLRRPPGVAAEQAARARRRRRPGRR